MSENLLIVMADQHTPFVTGYSGNAHAHTPNLDRFAERGTVFETAYTTSPICVPARASMVTGRYVHEIGNWDNAAAYRGDEAPSWGARAVEAGVSVTTIGKLHFAGEDAPTGFPDQRLPMHVTNGGDLAHALRGAQPPTSQLRDIVIDAGPGESSYTAYDRAVADAAVAWLRLEAPASSPWALMVSFATPHYPLIAPPEHLAHIDAASLPMPAAAGPDEWNDHERVAEYREKLRFDDPISPDRTRRAIAAYYGLVSFMDEQVGRVLDTLEETGLDASTTVVYCSDHGEVLGAHGLWFKGTMHEGSVRIPMLIAGPTVPVGRRVRTPVSIVDVFPTALDVLGIESRPADHGLPGRSLRRLAVDAEDPDRVAFSEYHSAFSSRGTSMVRVGDWKYIHHPDARPQLFNLADDPDELHDLAGDDLYSAARDSAERSLRAIVDPERVDREARADQSRRVGAAGYSPHRARRLVPYTPAPTADRDHQLTPGSKEITK